MARREVMRVLHIGYGDVRHPERRLLRLNDIFVA
jgi:hypothetical protein